LRPRDPTRGSRAARASARPREAAEHASGRSATMATRAERARSEAAIGGRGRSSVMAERYESDVVILGAGPAGTAAAVHLGALGVRSVALVDRHDFPRDKTCGSGVSPKGIKVLKELGVWSDVEPH